MVVVQELRVVVVHQDQVDQVDQAVQEDLDLHPQHPTAVDVP